MKHHSKKIVISFLMLLASNIAFSDEVIDKNVGPYVSLNFGAAIPTTQDINFYLISSELETGFSFGAAVGYAFSNNFRVEGELAYQLNNSSTSYLAQSIDTNIHTLAGLINGYYDFKNSSDFTPYISAGIGVGGIINEFANDLGAAFAYQVGAGVDYSITDKITLGVKYRYTGRPVQHLE